MSTDRAVFTRRALLQGTLSIAALGALAACTTTTAGGGGVQKPKSGTLTIMTTQGEITSAEVKAFEKAYPGLKLKLINYDLTRLNASLAAGNPPDLVRSSGTDVTPYIAARDIAIPLDDYIKSSSVIKESDIMPINDVWRWDGKKQGAGPRYGLAKDWSQDAMWWYDNSAWSEAGLQLPSADTPMTYDEILDAARKLTATSGGKTTRYGLWAILGAGASNFIASMVATTGGRILSEDLASVDYSSPEAQKALQWVLDASKANVSYSPINPVPDWDGPQYVAGKQAVAQAGYWFGSYLGGTKQSLESTTSFAPAPLLGTDRVSPSYAAVGYWIPRKSKNQGAAFEFIEWYCAGADAKKRLASGGGLPTLHSLLDVLPDSTEFQKKALATQKNELQYQKVIALTSPYAQVAAFDAVVTPAITSAIQNGQTAAKLGDALTAGVNKVLSDGKKQLGK